MTAGIFGGLGLAAERLTFGPATLVTVASDHVALRTPERPDWWPGNRLHLLRPPTDLPRWFDRFDRSLGQLTGVRRRVISWEVDGAPEVPDVAVPHGAELHGPVALELEDLVAPQVPDGFELLAATDDRHWAGAKVLYLHSGWDGAEPHWRWLTAQHRAIVEAGRGQVWLAYRHGIPAARASLFHDQAGLAVVDDVITHPLHRGQGVAGALVAHAVRHLAAAAPDTRFVVVAEPGDAAERLYQRLGFALRSRIFTVVA